MAQMKIILNTTDGNSVSVDVQPDETYRMLKERIQIESGIELEISQIFYDGKPVEEDQNVYESFLGVAAAQSTDKSPEEAPRVCIVEGCPNSKLPDPKVEIFEFPLETDRYSNWLLACGRHDLLGRIPVSLNLECGVCAEHFPDSCFTSSRMKKRLLKNAIPVLEESQSNFSILAEDMIMQDVKLEDDISLNDCGDVTSSAGFDIQGSSLQGTSNPTDLDEEEHAPNRSENSAAEADEEDLQEDELEELDEDEDEDLEDDDDILGDNTSLEHPGLICRLCASAVDTAHFVFSEKGREEKIFHKISTSLPISIHCNDPLPKQVCGQCLTALNTCYDFAMLCVKAERKLQKLVPRFRCHRDSQVLLPRSRNEDNHSKDTNSVEEKNDEETSQCYDCPLCCEGHMESQENVNIDEIEGREGKDAEDVVQDFLADSVLWEDGEDFLEAHQNLTEGDEDLSGNDEGDECYPCLVCGSSFISLAHLLEHSESHQDSESFICGHCALSFNSKETLGVHLDLVMNSTPEEHYKCGTCGKMFVSESRAEFHHAVTHEMTGFSSLSCSECGQIFSNETNLWDHVQIEHRGLKPFSCPKCDRTFHMRTLLKTHMRVHDEKSSFDNVISSGSFPSRFNTRSHETNHVDDKMFQCEHCGQCFMRKYLLTVHVRSHVDKKPRVYTCRVCGADGFESLPKLLIHRRSVHQDVMLPLGSKKEKTHKCEQCNKSFAGRVALKHHALSHTGELPHVCEFCNKGFTQKRSLLLHRRTHTGEKPFECGECGKRFVQSAHLYAHLRLHTGEKPYPCSECGATFRLKDVRDSHQRKHTGERPFKCKECDKSFRTSHSYYQHTWIHSGRKPYPCTYCGKAFRRSNGLKVHIRIHTGEKPHKCDVCGRGFAQKQDMRKHRNLHTMGRL